MAETEVGLMNKKQSDMTGADQLMIAAMGAVVVLATTVVATAAGKGMAVGVKKLGNKLKARREVKELEASLKG